MKNVEHDPLSMKAHPIKPVVAVRSGCAGTMAACFSLEDCRNGVWTDVTSEYDAFRSARARCENERNKSYKDYGGRGILFRFCSFQSFLDAVGRKPSDELSLDRIDNDGHYESGNLRWATSVTQSANRSRQ